MGQMMGVEGKLAPKTGGPHRVILMPCLNPEGMTWVGFTENEMQAIVTCSTSFYFFLLKKEEEEEEKSFNCFKCSPHGDNGL